MPDLEPQDMTDDQLDALLEQTEETADGLLDDTPLEIADEDDDSGEEDKDGADEDDDAKDDDDNKEVIEEDADDNKEVIEESDEDDDDAEEGDDDDAVAATPDDMRAVLTRLDELETRNEGLQAALDRSNLLRDRAAGRAGSLKQKLERDAAGADDEFDDEDADADAKSKTAAKSEAEEAMAEIRIEKVERAMGSAAADFYEANAGFFQALAEQVSPEANKDFQAELVTKVREAQAEIGDDLLSMSPKMASKVSDTLLRSAFADMKLKLVQDLKTKATDQADESRKKIRARKKGAAGTRSNKRPAAKQNAKPKSVKEMTDKELDAALAQAARAGSYD